MRAAPLLLAASSLSLQTGSAVATLAFPALGAPGVLALRVGLAAVVLVALTRAWRALPRGRALGLVVAFGAVLGLMNLLFYLALERVPLGVTVALELTGPLALALASSRGRREALVAVLAAAGVAVLVGPTAVAAARGSGGGLDGAGVLLGLGAGACWAGYIVLGARVSRAVAPATGLAWALAAASVLLVPLGAATAGTALLTAPALLVGAAVALLSAVLPYTAELVALRSIGPAAFGVMMSLQPAVATLTGLVVAGQAPGTTALTGVGCIVVASLAAVPRRPAAAGA